LDYVSVKTLIEQEKPAIVAFPSEGGDLAYQFFKICLDKGIPCIGIQHGALDYSPPTVHLPEEMGIGKPQYLPRPTKLLVYGSYYRDFLIRNGGYPKDEIVVVGNFRFDPFANSHKPSKKSMIEKFNLDGKKPIILYTGQVLPSAKEYEEMTRVVFNAAKELGFTLIVKQHPGEVTDALYHKLARETGIKPLVTQTASTIDLLTVCDVLVGHESTLDYEAMILDKPVVVLNFSNQPNTLPFVEEGAAIGVFTPDGVVPAIKRALFDGDTRAVLGKRMHDLIKAHCYKIDGKAAERAAEIIRELIK
jgi:UDP-N-acetylglucosamine 2-epimerase